jgi:hypothetical protein
MYRANATPRALLLMFHENKWQLSDFAAAMKRRSKEEDMVNPRYHYASWENVTRIMSALLQRRRATFGGVTIR